MQATGSRAANRIKFLPFLSLHFTIFTTGILVSAPKSASAFCVHNLTGAPIIGDDVRRTAERDEHRWAKYLNPNQKNCCPGNRRECQGAELVITSRESRNGTGDCTLSPGDRGLVEVRYRDRQMVCNVR